MKFLIFLAVTLLLFSHTQAHNPGGKKKKAVHHHDDHSHNHTHDHHHHDHDDEVCGEANFEGGAYDPLFHWVAAGIIVLVSLVGSLSPILFDSFVKGNSFLIQCGSLFGAGTILVCVFFSLPLRLLDSYI